MSTYFAILIQTKEGLNITAETPYSHACRTLSTVVKVGIPIAIGRTSHGYVTLHEG